MSVLDQTIIFYYLHLQKKHVGSHHKTKLWCMQHYQLQWCQHCEQQQKGEIDAFKGSFTFDEVKRTLSALIGGDFDWMFIACITLTGLFTAPHTNWHDIPRVLTKIFSWKLSSMFTCFLGETTLVGLIIIHMLSKKELKLEMKSWANSEENWGRSKR